MTEISIKKLWKEPPLLVGGLLCILILVTLTLFLIHKQISAMIWLLALLVSGGITAYLSWMIYQDNNTIERWIGWIFLAIISILYFILFFHALSQPTKPQPEDAVLRDSNTAGIYVMKSSVIHEPAELANRKIGYLDDRSTQGTDEVMKYLEDSELKVELIPYQSSLLMAQDLRGFTLDAMVYDHGWLKDLRNYDEMDHFHNDIEPIFTVRSVPVDQQQEESSHTLNLLLSGSQNYGYPQDQGPSDTNLIISINTEAKTVLMTALPANLYLPLVIGEKNTSADEPPATQLTDHAANDENSSDILRSIGYYGTDVLASSIEDYLGIAIDGTIRFNLNGLSSILNVLQQIRIYSPASFTVSGVPFHQGFNEVSPAQALTYIRRRYDVQENSDSQALRSMLLVQGVFERIMQEKNPSDILTDLLSFTISSLDEEQLAMMESVPEKDASGWQFWFNEFSGIESDEFSAITHSNVEALLPLDESKKRTRWDIQAILAGEIPPYTLFSSRQEEEQTASQDSESADSSQSPSHPASENIQNSHTDSSQSSTVTGQIDESLEMPVFYEQNQPGNQNNTSVQ